MALTAELETVHIPGILDLCLAHPGLTSVLVCADMDEVVERRRDVLYAIRAGGVVANWRPEVFQLDNGSAIRLDRCEQIWRRISGLELQLAAVNTLCASPETLAHLQARLRSSNRQVPVIGLFRLGV